MNNLIENFANEYFPSTSSNGQVVESRGLRLLCLGNPERSIQGELYSYLRSSRVNAVAECALSSDSSDLCSRRNIDIVVFDDQWNPSVAIEIKHYSGNQGRINTLLANLEEDLNKHKESAAVSLDIIQLGIYTSIQAIDESDISKICENGFYRFLSTYCVNKPPTYCDGNIAGYRSHKSTFLTFSVNNKSVIGSVLLLWRRVNSDKS